MLHLAQQLQLFRVEGSFSRTAFDEEFDGALRWAIEEYHPKLPFQAQGIWHDFIHYKAEESTWRYICKGSNERLVV